MVDGIRKGNAKAFASGPPLLEVKETTLLKTSLKQWWECVENACYVFNTISCEDDHVFYEDVPSSVVTMFLQ